MQARAILVSAGGPAGRLLHVAMLAALLWTATGCVASEPYRVKLGGEVLLALKDAPRELKSGVYTSTEAEAVRKSSGGKTQAADRATVTMRLQFGEARLVDHVIPIAPAHTKDGKFLFETRSDAFDRLGEIRITVESSGKSTEIRRFTTPLGVAFEENVLVVLEDTPAVAPPNPLDAPANAAKRK